MIKRTILNQSFQLHSANDYPGRNFLGFCKLKHTSLRIIIFSSKSIKIFRGYQRIASPLISCLLIILRCAI